ncbi:MAG: ABC transporter ATP-binding protein, partial [Acidimicrobiales bacterium]
MSNEPGSVEIVNVTKRFGGTVAVDDVNLEVNAGEFLSLLGPSGCGKTTTLRMLAGFEEPDEGFIRISGNFVQGVPPYRRAVNTVFQHYALFPHMTVAENVAYGLRQKNVAKADVRRRVAEALEMVKMTKLAKRKPRQMSGGQQQRVALARALVNKPSVLLLDEPLGALDRKLRQEMQIELKLLQTQVGITFIYVTHDQEEALSMSDRIAIMLDGHIEQLDDPDAIYEHPVSAFVAGFIGQNNFLQGRATGDGSELAGHAFVVKAISHAPDVVVGEPALAAIRPESILLAAGEPPPSSNVL